MQLTKVDIAGLIVVGLLLIAQDARSDDIILHGGSKHIGADGYDVKVLYRGRDNQLHDIGTRKHVKFNESNLGVGYSHDINKHIAVRGGVYDNSYNRTSVYVGAAASVAISRSFDIGVQVGAVTGYAGTPQGSGAVSPFVLPYVRGGYGRLFGEIGYLPPVDGISVITWSVGVTF